MVAAKIDECGQPSYRSPASRMALVEMTLVVSADGVVASAKIDGKAFTHKASACIEKLAMTTVFPARGKQTTLRWAVLYRKRS